MRPYQSWKYKTIHKNNQHIICSLWSLSGSPAICVLTGKSPQCNARSKLSERPVKIVKTYLSLRPQTCLTSLCPSDRSQNQNHNHHLNNQCHDQLSLFQKYQQPWPLVTLQWTSVVREPSGDARALMPCNIWIIYIIFKDHRLKTIGTIHLTQFRYVKLISSDGHEFIVSRDHALTSGGYYAAVLWKVYIIQPYLEKYRMTFS